MAKTTIFFECTHCGRLESKWHGRCDACGEWNSFVEGRTTKKLNSGGGKNAGSQYTGNGIAEVQALRLSDITVQEQAHLVSGINEFDRVLGGGVLRGASVLIGGEPGIGKSTLMLQLAAAYSTKGKILYISGEEAASQLKMRAERLGIESSDILIFSGTQTEDCVDEILRCKAVVVIVDSVQTLRSDVGQSAAGSPNQIKFSVQQIIDAARIVQASSFLIAHVTKEGAIAGPKLLEHLVDTVIHFDHCENELRYLRVSKNRFGSSSEIGLFSMDENGLNEVNDTSNLFLEDSAEVHGTAVVPVYEGSRILMVEIQALTVAGRAGFGRVYSDKIDQRRVVRISAVLEKHLNIKFSDQDIYVNVAGGIRLEDVAIELGLAIALYSARTGISVLPRSTFCGEITLSGNIRKVSHVKSRIQNAAERGFSNIIYPKGSDIGKLGGIPIGNLSEAIKFLLQKNT